AVERLRGDRLTGQAVDDLAAFITGGAGSFITAWILDGAPDPEAFTDRLTGVISLLVEVR
ncbi:MAG TPA: TetR-like C-terminal domain-containing protein, partial [Lentzea sp.]